jgi:FLVCR family feline leukemia virus subgroup C receptor-related protein
MSYSNIYGTIINGYFSGLYELTNSMSSIIGSISNVIGIVGSLIVSYILDKRKKYKPIFILLNVVGLLSHCLYSLSLELFYYESSFYIVLVLYSLCAFACFSIYTCSMDFACELTYPVPESIPAGLLVSSASVFTFVIVLQLI